MPTPSPLSVARWLSEGDFHDTFERTLGELLDSEWADYQRRCVEVTARGLSAQCTYVAFGGQFSSGKSTLLSALSECSVLPTRGIPETGAPCWLLPGGANEAWVVQKDGERRQIPFTRGAIRREISILDENMLQRSGLGNIERVELEVESSSMPEGIVWIDSPGIDSRGMDERAAVVADKSDILAWVIDSRRAFSTIEWDFLLHHIERRGEGSALVVVNGFLEEDGTERWQAFLDDDFAAIEHRIMDVFDEWELTAPPIVPVSARAGLADRAGYGMSALRALLNQAQPGSGWANEVRFRHAATGIGELAKDAEMRVRKGDEEVAERDRQRAQVESANEQARSELTDAAQSEVAKLLGLIEDVGLEIARDIRTKSLIRDNSYGERLGAAAKELAEEAVDSLYGEVGRVAKLHDMSVAPAMSDKLSQLLEPGPIVIEVPDYPVGPTARERRNAEALERIGGDIASSLSSDWSSKGRELGRSLGSGWGRFVDSLDSNKASPVQEAIQRDRDGAQRALRRAVSDVSERWSDQAEQIASLLVGGCVLADVPTPAPGRKDLTATRAVYRALRDAAEALQDLSQAAGREARA